MPLINTALNVFCWLEVTSGVDVGLVQCENHAAGHLSINTR